MGNAELNRRSDITQEAQKIWADWICKAQELIEQLPLLPDEESEWVVPRMRDILNGHRLQHGMITQPARHDIDHLRLARVIFSIIRNHPLEPDIPRGISYQTSRRGITFRRLRETGINVIQPRELVFFIENYGLAGNDINKSGVPGKYCVSPGMVKLGIKEARWVILNHPAVKPIWAQVP